MQCIYGLIAIAGQTTVIVQNSPNNTVPLSEQSVRLVCPHWHTTVSTVTSYKLGGATWLASGIICLLG